MSDPDLAAAVALLRAALHGDVAGRDAIIATTEPDTLLGAVVRAANLIGVAVFDTAEGWDEVLAGWQQEHLRLTVGGEQP